MTWFAPSRASHPSSRSQGARRAPHCDHKARGVRRIAHSAWMWHAGARTAHTRMPLVVRHERLKRPMRRAIC